jgi:hypothetical protein
MNKDAVMELRVFCFFGGRSSVRSLPAQEKNVPAAVLWGQERKKNALAPLGGGQSLSLLGSVGRLGAVIPRWAGWDRMRGTNS